METIFKKILCPIDFDRVSVPAVEMVKRLGSQGDAKVFLMYVIPQGTRRAMAPADEQQVSEDNLRSIAHKWFEGVAPFELIIRAGDPAAEIVHAAKELRVDLVVMATHGRTGLDHMLLGSVAERVVRECRKPVLTVRPVAAEK